MDQVMDAQTGTQGEMVFIPESEHACNGLAAPFPLFIGKRNRPTGSRFKSPFDDFLRRAAHTSGERGFEQLPAVR
jgi:hypothetical protein